MSKQDELVLVTGASGFIAAWVVKYALDAGYRVRGTVRDPTNEKKVSFLRELPGAKERLELVALDLEKSGQEVFDKAVDGCTLVAHTASPFPAQSPKHEDDLIKPAVNGTTSVLRAVAKTPTVKRVVVTSSVAALGESSDDKPLGENDWTNVNSPDVDAYSKSKTLAEKAAWQIFKAADKPSWTLTTINPSFVVGPSIGPEKSTSAEIGIRLLNAQMPMLPRLGFGVVDVRDVARAHINALELPAESVSGRRFILYNTSLWMADMAQSLSITFQPLGYNIPKRNAPYFLMWIVSLFDPSVRLILPRLNKTSLYDNTPSKDILGINYHPLDKTFADYGHALVYHKMARKLSGYKLPTEGWTPSAS